MEVLVSRGGDSAPSGPRTGSQSTRSDQVLNGGTLSLRPCGGATTHVFLRLSRLLAGRRKLFRGGDALLPLMEELRSAAEFRICMSVFGVRAIRNKLDGRLAPTARASGY